MWVRSADSPPLIPPVTHAPLSSRHTEIHVYLLGGSSRKAQAISGRPLPAYGRLALQGAARPFLKHLILTPCPFHGWLALRPSPWALGPWGGKPGPRTHAWAGGSRLPPALPSLPSPLLHRPETWGGRLRRELLVVACQSCQSPPVGTGCLGGKLGSVCIFQATR